MTPQSWNSGSVAALARLARREEGFPNRVQVQGEAEQILRSRLNYQGSLLNLQGQLSQEATWQLWTSPDLEAIAVFDYALEAQDLWQTELGRMTRGLLARMQGGTWDTTLSNAAGSSSFRRFRQLFEKEAVAGSTQLSLGPVEETITWDEKPLKNQKSLPWSSPSEPKNQILRLVHEGTGKPWVHVQTTAAIPLKAAIDRGYLIQKSLHPVSQKTSGIWSVGDVVDVRIKIDAQADQAWVVVRDSIPAGASHLGSGLEGESSFLDQTKAKGIRAEAWPSEFAERAQGSFVAYAASVPKGTYLLSYRIRLNSAGQFKLSPTRVEAMYAKEMFGEIPYADWKVVP
jgi:uncharacterized protein YfaS (alpha-2-macroglobulin family)